jgi:hypothetical protein
MSGNTLRSWNYTAVRCLAGYKAKERPISFLLDEREIEVDAILESWREPDYLCFRVETDDNSVYDLRHHEYEDFWQVTESPRIRHRSSD